MATKKYLSYDGLAEYDALLKAEISQGDESAVSSAKTYTDEEIATAKSEIQTYIDTNKQDKNLIVTFADSSRTTSTHTSQEIYAAINEGTSVYFNNGGINFAYLEGAPSVVNFYNCFYNNDVMQADVYEIRGNQVTNAHFQNNIIKQSNLDSLETELKKLIDDAKDYTDESVVTYSLSKDGTTIILTGSDDSLSTIEESITTATDDNAGNVVLESTDAIAHIDEALKQEIIAAVLASLTTETLTFTLNDGTTVTKEVVVK